MPKHRLSARISDPFEARYPYLAAWVQHKDGVVELGRDDFSGSFARAIDACGKSWDGAASYPSVDAALGALEDAIAIWKRDKR